MASKDSRHEEMRKRVSRFINHPLTDGVVMILIVISIGLLLAEVAVSSNALKLQLRLANEAIVYVFIVELVLRFVAERKKARFFRQYWIDILAVIPWFRPLRVLRVLRLLRIFRFGVKLSRRMGWLNASLQRSAIQSFALFIMMTVIVLFGGIGLRVSLQQEPEIMTPIEDAMWWSVMSVVAGEPIGVVPDNTLGRVITLTVMVAGLFIFAFVTGTVSALMVHRLGRVPVAMDLDELEKHIVICGWNRSGEMLLQEFQGDPETSDRAVVIVAEFEDEPMWPPSLRRPELIYVVRGDFTRLEILSRARLEHASHAIILADRLKERSDQDRDARSVLTALLIERINKGIFTSVELLNRDNETFLKLIGVEEVVVAEEYAARVIASATKNEGLVSLVDELLTSNYGNQIYKVEVTHDLMGMAYADVVALLKHEHDATIIGVEGPGTEGASRSKRMELNPAATRVIGEGDRLLCIAHSRPLLG